MYAIFRQLSLCFSFPSFHGELHQIGSILLAGSCAAESENYQKVKSRSCTVAFFK